MDANKPTTKEKYIVNKDNNDIKYLDEVGKLRSDISVDLLNPGDIRYISVDLLNPGDIRYICRSTKQRVIRYICRSTKHRWYQIYL